MCTSGNGDKISLKEKKNTENAHGLSIFFITLIRLALQNTAYPHLSILQEHLNLSFLYSYIHLLKGSLTKQKLCSIHINAPELKQWGSRMSLPRICHPSMQIILN